MGMNIYGYICQEKLNTLTLLSGLRQNIYPKRTTQQEIEEGIRFCLNKKNQNRPIQSRGY